MSVWHICMFELRRILKIRSVVLNLFLLPLLLIFILGTALSSTMGNGKEAVPGQVRVGMVETAEAANSTVGKALKAYVASPEVVTMLKVENMNSQDEAVDALKKGELDFAVIVTSDMVRQWMAGEKTTLQWILGKDGTLNVVGQTLFTRFTDELNRQMAMMKVLGPEMTLNSVPGADAKNGLVAQSNITISSPGNSNQSYSASQYYAAAMLAMFMLYSGMTTINSLFTERDKNTLARLQASPVGTGVIFAGKIAGNSLLAFMQAIVIIVMTHLLFGVNWGRHPWWIILICVLITLASMTLGSIVALLSKNATSATALMQGIIIVMTFISGGFTPIAIDVVQRISEFTVNHWALQSFLSMMLDAPSREIMHNIYMLGVVCAVLAAAAAVIYRKVGYRYE
ncbi:ABC transporter permease [Paenibacillus barcinonensis]|uniref:ABC transporter permease n=1 Tax=Paenibacillus barcinonensis TaxID=198119 RepID=A0A2V4WQW3_PAEBA|nr:ABC transporter permease [Paenibacillus barcinonensis]PYE50604.1 ABC-2 type transport system permease protein [Paenibacillus barcinonensis]QKS57301.1 ABC transporter permease [Paenibacillus barcinonensis]